MNVSFIFVFTNGLKYAYVYLHGTILSKCAWLRVNLRLRLILFILLWWKIVWSASLSICPRTSLLASVSRVGIFFTAELYAKEIMIKVCTFDQKSITYYFIFSRILWLFLFWVDLNNVARRRQKRSEKGICLTYYGKLKVLPEEVSRCHLIKKIFQFNLWNSSL